MKQTMMLKQAVRTWSRVDVGGNGRDPDLAALDRGVLTVALLVAGLDGVILPAEFEAFVLMAKRCRGATAKKIDELFDSAIGDAGKIAAMAQSGVYSKDEILAKFVAMAKRALPEGFASGSSVDLRRAFAIWIAMGVSDGGFSAFENQCVHALVRCFILSRAGRVQRFAAVIEPGFVARVEHLVKDMYSEAKYEKAEKALLALIQNGTPPPPRKLKPRRAAKRSFALPGPTIPGWR